MVKEDLAPLMYIQNAQNETGDSKCPPNTKIFDPPPPPSEPPCPPWGSGSGTEWNRPALRRLRVAHSTWRRCVPKGRCTQKGSGLSRWLRRTKSYPACFKQFASAPAVAGAQLSTRGRRLFCDLQMQKSGGYCYPQTNINCMDRRRPLRPL